MPILNNKGRMIMIIIDVLVLIKWKERYNALYIKITEFKNKTRILSSYKEIM